MRRRAAAALLAISGVLLPATAAWGASGVDRTITDPRITESSGLAVSPAHDGVLWTHDDSGNPPVIFALGRSGRVTGTVRLTGVPDVDWEAMAAFRDAAGRATLAIGDIGDNEAARSSVEIDLVPEPARLGADVERPRLRLVLRYPDGPRDAETLLVDTARRRMFVVSKGLLSGDVYAVPAAAWNGTLPSVPTSRAATLVRVGTVPLVLETDGTIAPDGTVLLRTYGDLAAFDPFPLDPGSGLLTPRATTSLPGEQQGEGLALEPDGRSVLLSSEGTDQPVLRFALPDALRPAAVSPPVSPSVSPAPPGSRSPAPPSRPGTPGAAAAAAPQEDLVRTGVLVGGAVLGVAAVAALAAAVSRGARRRSRRSG